MTFYLSFLTEGDGPSSNDKGVMHELLVGKHLNGGKHMDHHPDSDGHSPEQAHNILKKKFSKSEYDEANKKAKSAAEDLKKTIKHHGDIHSVHWTSKPGDLHRSTGIHATQKQDASDIVISTKKGSKVKYHGVSLKVTDKNSGHVPVSNPGMEATHGGHHVLEKSREEIKKNHPALGKLTNKASRKEWLKKNPKADADIRAHNERTLSSLVKHVHKKLSKLPSHELAQHIRDHVLHAHKTPMQEKGHNHIRHTTYGNGTTHHADPANDHEHILKDHKNISTHVSGNSVVFSHKGTPFARHRMKFESQSDPLSSVKGSGELMGTTKKKTLKEFLEGLYT